MQGAPVTTQDLDLLLRETAKNEEKIARFCVAMGAAQPVAIGALTHARTILGATYPIDLLFDEIAGGLTFESVRSRSERIPLGDMVATVASLADVIRSKEAANRPKDLAALPILRETLAVKAALRTIEEESNR